MQTQFGAEPGLDDVVVIASIILDLSHASCGDPAKAKEILVLAMTACEVMRISFGIDRETLAAACAECENRICQTGPLNSGI